MVKIITQARMMGRFPMITVRFDRIIIPTWMNKEHCRLFKEGTPPMEICKFARTMRDELRREYNEYWVQREKQI
jgi:hypothetical protein